MPKREWTAMDAEAEKQGKATSRMIREFGVKYAKNCKGQKSASSREGRLRLATGKPIAL